MYRSNDGGQTFTVIGDWQLYPGPSIHADHHAIVAHPMFNGTTNKTV